MTPAERLLRVNWTSALSRGEGGVALLAPEFVVEQGRSVQIVDLREPFELVGPIGHIPGVAWIPAKDALVIADRLPSDAPVVLVSRRGRRAAEVARALAERGMTFVAAMRGGMVAWKDLGYATTRDPAVLKRLGELAPAVVTAPATSASGARPPLTLAEIRDHVGDVRSVRWVKMASVLLHGKLSCVDGRDDHGVIGTPGGDAGKFLLALATIEQLTGKPIDAARVPDLLVAYMDAFGRFYLHSDVHALNRFIASMRSDPRLEGHLPPVTSGPPEWRAFMQAPPVAVRDLILEHLIVPEHLGCGHVRLMLTRSDVYGVRRELVEAFLRAYFQVRWDGATELEFVALGGGHQEGAVVSVELDDDVYALSRVPLISPACGGSQMFVTHPQVATYIRRQIARFVTRQPELPLELSDAERFTVAMGELAQRQLVATLGELAKGLPFYTVRFHRDHSFRVTEG